MAPEALAKEPSPSLSPTPTPPIPATTPLESLINLEVLKSIRGFSSSPHEQPSTNEDQKGFNASVEKYLKELDNKIQSIIDNEKFLYERLQELNLTVNDIHKNTTILLSSKVFPPSEPISGPKYSPPTATGTGIPPPTPCSCPLSQGTSSGTPLQATSSPPASCASGPPVVTNSGPSSPVSYSVPPPTVTPSWSQATSSGPPAASSTVSSTPPTPPPEIATVQSNIPPPPSKNVPPPPPMHHIKPRRSLLGAPP